jgi:ABC-type methionine transport system ATPase subunit
MVIVTHEVRFAGDVADQVLFLDGGVVVERGGPEVITHPQNERPRQFLPGSWSPASCSSQAGSSGWASGSLRLEGV